MVYIKNQQDSQKSKGKKRPRGWHRGQVEAEKFIKTMQNWPSSGIPPELQTNDGAPGKLHKIGGKSRDSVA